MLLMIGGKHMNQSNHISPQKGVLFGLIAVAIWTGFILVSRAGALSHLEMADLVAVRFGTALIVLSPLVWKFRKQWLQPRMFVLGSIGGLAYAVSVYSGFARAPASHAALLLPGLMPIVIAVLASLMLKETKSATTWIGISLSSVGVMVLILESLLDSREYLGGDLLFVLACIFWAIYTVLLRQWKLQPWPATVIVVAVASTLYLPVYIAVLPKGIFAASWQTVAVQAVYQGIIATIVQMLFYVRAVQAIGPTRMGALMALVPVMASVLAVPLFGESVSLGATIGIMLGGFGAILAALGGNIPLFRYWISRRPA